MLELHFYISVQV